MSPSASVTSTGGVRTLSITWMTPFDASTSAVVTVASPIMTVPSATVKVASSPFSMVTVIPSVTADDSTDPEYTWYVRMSARVAFSSSVSNVVRSMPAAAKASSVGANTVKGPSACSAVTRLACARAATSESCTPVLCAFVGISSASSAATIGASDIAPIVNVTYIPTINGMIILLFFMMFGLSIH